MKIAGLFRLLLIGASCVLAAIPAAARGFSALAVDAHTGEILFSQAPDAQRYPASLTKVMTLYVLFEEIKAGRMTLATKLKVSRHAASRPPSRLGLKVGETISVENAIKALVTRSANDVAAAIGENISGSETAFALRMTKTARSIGMTRSTFRNASGLPNPAQITTARDMATLGLRIQRDFPGYYPYFSTSSFTYKGQIIRTHNRLLGRFKGTDGIKTGYIRASGFNLTTSTARGGKRMIGVVMGANSGSARNQYMMKMLDRHFVKAKTSKKNAIAAMAGNPPGVEAGSLVDTAAASAPADKPAVTTPAAAPTSQALPSTQHSPPTSVGTVAETVPDAQSGVDVAEGGPGPESSDAGEEEASVWPTPASSAKGNSTAAASLAPLPPPRLAPSAPPASEMATLDVDAAAIGEQPRSGGMNWNIQVGAYPNATDARRRLDEVRALKLGSLRQKTALAIPVSKGKSKLYRARFLGFSEKSARETCRQLTKHGVGCLTLAPQG